MAQHEVSFVFSLNILKYRCKWLHFFCKLFLNDTQCASFNFMNIRILDLVGIWCQTLFEPKCYSCKILCEPECYSLPSHPGAKSSWGAIIFISPSEPSELYKYKFRFKTNSGGQSDLDLGDGYNLHTAGSKAAN